MYSLTSTFARPNIFARQISPPPAAATVAVPRRERSFVLVFAAAQLLKIHELIRQDHNERNEELLYTVTK